MVEQVRPPLEADGEHRRDVEGVVPALLWVQSRPRRQEAQPTGRR